MSKDIDLSGVSTDALLTEIYRRRDALVISLTANDLAEAWDNGSELTDKGKRLPVPADIDKLRRSFERWQDHGSLSDLYDTLRQSYDNILRQEGGSK